MPVDERQLPFTQVYTNYDKAVADMLRDLRYPPGDSGEPVLIVFATPNRAFSQARERLLRKYNTTVPNDKHPLPLISIDREDEQHDPTREHLAKFRRLWHPDGDKTEQMWWPIPTNFIYKISFWQRLLRDKDHLATKFRLKFRSMNMTYLTVDHPWPAGTKQVFTKLDGIVRAPVFEDANRKGVVRFVATITVGGWVVRDYEERGLIEQAVIDVDEEDADQVFIEDLDDITVTEGV